MTSLNQKGSAPYGYQFLDKALTIVKIESKVRKEIYEIFINCKRLKTTAEKINQRGYQTRSNSKFTDTTILRLLTDPIVLGIENETPAIISQEKFDTVQKILSTQESTARLPVHLFSGIVYCGNCDTKMRVFSSISKKYTCPDCRRKIDKNDLEKIYLSQLENYTNHKSSKFKSIKKRWKSLDDESKIQLIKAATNRITVLGKEVEITFYSLSSKDINDGTLATQQSQVSAQNTNSQQIINKKVTKKERRLPIVRAAIKELFGEINPPDTLQIGDGEVNLIFRQCQELEQDKPKKDQVFNIAFSTFLRTQGYWSFIKESLPFDVIEVAPRHRK